MPIDLILSPIAKLVKVCYCFVIRKVRSHLLGFGLEVRSLRDVSRSRNEVMGVGLEMRSHCWGSCRYGARSWVLRSAIASVLPLSIFTNDTLP
ncbi:MAG: hypothetical protein KME54_16885 [Tolypothrix brevis GSE-NOS-MK-07-07A]|nr:hypothetical protein [Tolypothrix brevis GSE-NOS-MK-07-07A]